jgi:hypothetical protein
MYDYLFDLNINKNLLIVPNTVVFALIVTEPASECVCGGTIVNCVGSVTIHAKTTVHFSPDSSMLLISVKIAEDIFCKKYLLEGFSFIFILSGFSVEVLCYTQRTSSFSSSI